MLHKKYFINTKGFISLKQFPEWKYKFHANTIFFHFIVAVMHCYEGSRWIVATLRALVLVQVTTWAQCCYRAAKHTTICLKAVLFIAENAYNFTPRDVCEQCCMGYLLSLCDYWEWCLKWDARSKEVFYVIGILCITGMILNVNCNTSPLKFSFSL